jgi:hypothetical protein
VIVFLAVGANRRRAVIDDVSRALAQSLAPVVVVNTIEAWRDDPIPNGARVVELAEVELRHRPRRWMHTALFGVPMAGMRRLGRAGQRTAAAYDRKIAGPFQRRMLMPLYKRIWPDKAARLLTEQVLGEVPQAVIATDPVSVAFAAAMIRTIRDSRSMPRVAFGFDYADEAGPAQPADRNAGEMR